MDKVVYQKTRNWIDCVEIFCERNIHDEREKAYDYSETLSWDYISTDIE